MNRSNACLLVLLFIAACTQTEPESLQKGVVKFFAVSISEFDSNIPNGRTSEPSTWKHIFRESATIDIINQATG
ncbi:hypothetical protein QWY93_05595 [Echinicola jeungdonensis]|uniref:Uncharacterized protein n=1 Tax=Echinicola jeungdonensis TaxID=709343 RepID=A0ABV5J4W3_9BACT|nr:hypothetical protein [Echinicola jeungdonensis]MDN3668796.1 hypothetical protein [Echinicola jeungdonensis]